MSHHFSIIIPAKNEANNISTTIKNIINELHNNQTSFEILVIDDGSTDLTSSAVKQLSQKDTRIHLIVNPPPFGFGHAIKTGLKHFNGDYCIIAMADASDDPKDIIHYIQKAEEGYDCCFGMRWSKETSPKGYPVLKFLLNRFVNEWLALIFRLPYRDLSNAFKCYSREVITDIQPLEAEKFNITVEMPLKSILRGYRYCVIPTQWYARKFGQTRFKFKELGSHYAKSIYSLWRNRHHLKNSQEPKIIAKSA